jgi:hypothetical protein
MVYIPRVIISRQGRESSAEPWATGNNGWIGEEEEMSLKSKPTQMRQKEYFEHHLQNRLAFLSGKGIEAAKVDKDSLVKKLKASIRAVNNRLRLLAVNEKRTAEMAKIKAERLAAPRKEEERAKAEKPKKAPEEGKTKKPKAEKKAAPPKEKGADKAQKPAESPEEGKAPTKKKIEETREEPAGQVKADE